MRKAIWAVLAYCHAFCTLAAQSYENTIIFGYAGGHYSVVEQDYGMNILTFKDGSLKIADDQLIDMWFNDTDAAISDKEGNLLFYYNGIYIEDVSRAIMQNGDTLNRYNETGYDLPQGGIIVPYPEQEDKYILFHSKEGWVDIPGWELECVGLYYSVIDMTKNNGLGSVVQRKVPLSIDTLAYGKLTMARHANGRDWWLAVGKSHTNAFYRFLIDPYGVHNLGLQSTGIARQEGIGEAFFSPDGTKYVVQSAISQTVGYYLDIYDFDRCSGLFNKHEQIHFTNGIKASGAVISPNSRWLYIPDGIYLFKLDLWASPVAPTRETIATYETFLDPSNTYFHRGFLAPDDKIYITTTGGSRTLHVVHQPDEPGTTCAFEQHGVRLPCYNANSLPTFANYRLGPLDGSPCDTLGLNNWPKAWYRYEQDTLGPLLVDFHDLSYYEPSEWSWDFGDGKKSIERHPAHQYPAKDIYKVCLTVSNVNGSDTHCKTLYLGVSAQSNPVLQSQVLVSPNPFVDRLSVALSANLRSPIFRLYDAMGGLVQEQQVVYGINEIETSSINNGMYFWEVMSNKEQIKRGKAIKINK